MINFLPFTKKNWIQNTTNLMNYTWNIVKNVCYWFTSENVLINGIYNLDLSKIWTGQYNPSNKIIITVFL